MRRKCFVPLFVEEISTGNKTTLVSLENSFAAFTFCREENPDDERAQTHQVLDFEGRKRLTDSDDDTETTMTTPPTTTTIREKVEDETRRRLIPCYECSTTMANERETKIMMIMMSRLLIVKSACTMSINDSDNIINDSHSFVAIDDDNNNEM